MQVKTKIVLDTDVILHFYKGELLTLLPDIFPEYEYIVLDLVRDEIKGPQRQHLDMLAMVMNKIRYIDVAQDDTIHSEYLKLRGRDLGQGESACMAYCKVNHDVVGSSNIKDVAEYCQANGITYLTTIDFLYYAIHRGKLTIEEANAFVKKVVEQKSKLPMVDFHTFVSDKVI